MYASAYERMFPNFKAGSQGRSRLRAAGGNRSATTRIRLRTFLLVAVLSWAVAVLAAWPLGKALGNHLVKDAFNTGLDFAFEPQGILIWLSVSIARATYVLKNLTNSMNTCPGGSRQTIGCIARHQNRATPRSQVAT